ncbi:UNVERIFIED_CONTAM: hypothetical protein HDU68_003888 [Siphonaria sp. JEL0065]|nr:hypothetical protein HDU68_003888 [Siphonaria sp. JEL0065]
MQVRIENENQPKIIATNNTPYKSMGTSSQNKHAQDGSGIEDEGGGGSDEENNYTSQDSPSGSSPLLSCSVADASDSESENEFQTTSAASEDLLPNGRDLFNEGLLLSTLQHGSSEHLNHRDKRQHTLDSTQPQDHQQQPPALGRRLFTEENSISPYTLFMRQLPLTTEETFAQPPEPVHGPESNSSTAAVADADEESNTQVLLGSRPDVLTTDGQINPALISMINDAKSFLLARQSRRGHHSHNSQQQQQQPRVPQQEHSPVRMDTGQSGL